MQGEPIKHLTREDNNMTLQELIEYGEKFGSGKHWDELTPEQKAFREEVQRENKERAQEQQRAFAQLAELQRKTRAAQKEN